MIEIAFKQISKINDDSLSGVVRFYENGTEEVKYFDDNFIGEFDRPMAISNELSEAIHKFDLTGVLGLYDEDDTHIIHNFKDFILIVNPNEDYTDTLVYKSEVYSDETPIEIGSLKCSKRVSIGDVIESVIDNNLWASRVNYNKVMFEHPTTGNFFVVCFGDVEMGDAFCRSMINFFLAGNWKLYLGDD